VEKAKKLIRYFKAQQGNKRYRENQKVWVLNDFGNFLSVVHKFRGKGRLINSYIAKASPIVGEIKEIEVDSEFWLKLYKKTIKPTTI
jgi:hypothetical protein